MKKLAKKFAQIFFGVESAEEMKKRGLMLSLAVPAFRWLDWMLVGVTATLVGFLKYQGIEGWKIFIILWVGNIMLAAVTVAISDRTGIDITLMEGLRRLVNAAIKKSVISGIIFETLIIIRLLLWEGACSLVIFLRERLRSSHDQWAVLFLASGIQMGVWTWIYSIGYDSFSGLIRSFF